MDTGWLSIEGSTEKAKARFPARQRKDNGMSPADETVQTESREISKASPSDEAGRLSFSVEEITPELASQMLEKSASKHTDKKATATYAKAMENGAWILNGQPIIFDEEGRLIDGVQRLSACIVAGVPFKTIVARNVRADTLHTIDQHRRRSYTGVLESRGIRNAGAVIRTMSKLIRIENGALGRDHLQFSWSRYDRVLAANPEIIEAVDIAQRNSGSQLHSTARPVLAYMALRAGHKTELLNFLRETGPNRTLGLDSPPGAFCMQVAVLQANGAALHVDHALALGILAFNDFVKGKKVTKHYSWKPDYGNAPLNKQGEPESMKSVRAHAPDNLGLPTVDGYPGLREGHIDTKADLADEPGDSQIMQELREGREADRRKKQVRMVNVTPDLAREWLQFNTENRKIQQHHIDVIARDITKGNWMLNAQPICFTNDPTHPKKDDPPRLLNGQHRLHAVIAADMPIEVPIATGIPEAAFATFDTHAKRNVRRTGARVDDRVIAAAAKLQWKEDHGFPLTGSGNTPSSSELLQTLDEHPDLPAGFGRSRRKGMTEIASAGVMTYFIYRVSREHAAYAEEFLDGLETGAGLEKGNPLLRIRNSLTKKKNVSRGDKLKVLIDAWEVYKVWKAEQEEEAKQAGLRLV